MVFARTSLLIAALLASMFFWDAPAHAQLGGVGGAVGAAAGAVQGAVPTPDSITGTLNGSLSDPLGAVNRTTGTVRRPSR
jgi:hypothetical protein